MILLKVLYFNIAQTQRHVFKYAKLVLFWGILVFKRFASCERFFYDKFVLKELNSSV